MNWFAVFFPSPMEASNNYRSVTFSHRTRTEKQTPIIPQIEKNFSWPNSWTWLGWEPKWMMSARHSCALSSLSLRFFSVAVPILSMAVHMCGWFSIPWQGIPTRPLSKGPSFPVPSSMFLTTTSNKLFYAMSRNKPSAMPPGIALLLLYPLFVGPCGDQYIFLE